MPKDIKDSFRHIYNSIIIVKYTSSKIIGIVALLVVLLVGYIFFQDRNIGDLFEKQGISQKKIVEKIDKLLDNEGIIISDSNTSINQIIKGEIVNMDGEGLSNIFILLDDDGSRLAETNSSGYFQFDSSIEVTVHYEKDNEPYKPKEGNKYLNLGDNYVQIPL